MGWIEKNPLLFVTLILLIFVALFGVLTIIMSIYIGFVLGNYLGFSYGLYGIPGGIGGILAVVLVIALLVVVKKKKTGNKSTMIGFVEMFGLLALGQFAFGLGFIAHDYEQKEVEYEGVKYENNVAMYEVKMRKEFGELLADPKYKWKSTHKLPPQPKLDALQTDFKCCGLHNSTDYWNVAEVAVLKSCCDGYKDFTNCKEYPQGCVKAVYGWLTATLVNFGVILFIASLFTIATTACLVVLVLTGKKITAPE